MSGLFLTGLLKEFKKKNYNVKILFIILNSPENCIDRIKHRVLIGGHDVPEKDVRRRFERGKRSFWIRYKKLADSWMLFNNTESGFELLAIGESDNFDITNETLFDYFKNSLK